jgi:transcriptional regulator with GAF, ATPase, and Fis domain
LDITGNRIETAASDVIGEFPAIPTARNAVSGELLQQLAGWCRAREVVYGPEVIGNLGLTALLPEDLPEGDILLAGLDADMSDAEQEPAIGALIVLAPSQTRFSKRDIEIVRQLIEPLAVGLANDRRVRELQTFREAAEAENRELRTRLHRESAGDAIVGAESGLAGVMERVQLVARSEAPVLILGETGTGKEVVARAIHRRSPRSSGPLIRVNCGAIPPELIDSELFGHERGSFTGATTTRKGWFERADGGTLFLDEIGELPLAAQVRLLRVLQDGTFVRVGGQTVLTADVRLVAATNGHLHAMVQQRSFREDLWYRVSVFPIHLPPLRDRPQDIPALAMHFAMKAARRLSLPPAFPTQQDLALLAIYPWPGNVRELDNVVERAAILGNGKYLEVGGALGIGKSAPVVPPIAAPSAARLVAPSQPPTLDQQTSLHIASVLAACHGRIEGPFGAAKTLGINPYTLRSRMRKLGIDWKRYRQNA